MIKKALIGLVRDHRERQFELRRKTEQAKRQVANKSSLAERASEEFDNYKKLSGMITESKHAWATFSKVSTTNLSNIGNLLGAISDLLKGLKHHTAQAHAQAQNGKPAFIELPESFSTGLAEVRMTMSTTDVDTLGMGPFISNLLEIMQDPKAVQKPGVTKALKNLLETLIEAHRDAVEDFEEENEHQVAFFESLEKAYADNVARSEQDLAKFKKIVSSLQKREDSFHERAQHAESLGDQVENVFSLRMKECRDFKTSQKFAEVRGEKQLAIVGQLEEIVATQSHALKSFFIQREMKTTH